MCWAELEALEAKPGNYDLLAEEDSIRISGEPFNTLTASLTGEPLMMLYNCDFNAFNQKHNLINDLNSNINAHLLIDR